MEVGALLQFHIDPLFEKLNSCPDLKEVFSVYGKESQVDALVFTVSKLRAMLLAADRPVELYGERLLLFEEFKNDILEAKTVVESFVTLGRQLKFLRGNGSLSEKAHLFFSRLNPLWFAYSMSRRVMKVTSKLDAIITSFGKLYIGVDLEPVRKRRNETCSYVIPNDIIGRPDDVIGREDDLEKIVGMLLDSTVEGDVSFLAIVGMGGLGKSALAQLVYNDPRVTSSFPLRLWICVSDQDQIQLDIEGSLRKMLDEATGGKKECSLIVLDDVWTEKWEQWHNLAEYFKYNLEGSSRIVVTTRSKTTATIVGGEKMMYELHGLSEKDSWCLFEKTAFGSDLSIPPPNDLIEIGGEIVNGCAGVPLAIRVAGSLLYGQDKSKWHSVQGIGLPNTRDNSSLPILRLSLHDLAPAAKSCVSYCALFPKDFEMDKETLISLWMAQGYILLNEAADAGEKMFSTLLHRCIFQDIKRDKYGEIMSCKMHDLMHDVAQYFAGEEMYVTESMSGNLDPNVRHLSVTGKNGGYLSGETHILSYLRVSDEVLQAAKVSNSYLESLIGSCPNLKALDLSGLIFESLPDSVSKLLQLRYLNLSGNTEMKSFPKSITELYNLQTLILRWCHALKELPTDLNRLVNLRLLDIRSCFSLTCMPRGMGRLTSLHRLSDYIVSGELNSSSGNQWLEGLDDLQPPNNLSGCLNINIRGPKKVKINRKVDYLLSKNKHLHGILFDFKHEEADGIVGIEEAGLMDKMQPHSNLKYLEVKGYQGVRMPVRTTHFPWLLEFHLTDCGELKYMPCLGDLHYLKVLKLIMLPNLEYIGDSPPAYLGYTLRAERLLFCPSLEILELSNLPKLKEWRGVEGDQLLNKAQLQLPPCFSQLKSLNIYNCPELKCIPACPTVEDLKLAKINTRLQIIKNPTKGRDDNPSTSSSLPLQSFQCLKSLYIWCNGEVETLGEFEEVFHSCSSSLRSLNIYDCLNLRGVVSGGLEHLAALEELELRNCDNLRLSGDEKEEGVYNIGTMPWSSNLRTLTLHGLPHLVQLPDWMQSLHALHSLHISYCNRFKSMPNWMPKLKSLNHLTVCWCLKSLERRCQQDPPGEDWAYIQHIQNINIRDCFY